MEKAAAASSDTLLGRLSLTWKDYRAKARTKHKTMTLPADKFLRRFLLHVLLQGFMPSKGLCGVTETGAFSGWAIGAVGSA